MSEFDILETIVTRRDGGRHSREELAALALGAGDGSIPDYQLAAWLMAAYLRPLDPDETAWLTLGMAESGDRLDLTGLPKPWVDKHSTGGVGDKTSIVLLPLLAACGLTVVKMSGRGLGITGGTLDKLSSIPGFRLDLTPSELITQAGRIGLALTGQSPRLAPADKTLYALRDTTATVASVPLIVSSILSKKIAGGAETVVLDVKCGSGAFMTDLPSAERLKAALEETGRRCGLNVKASISDMSQPLGSAVGNAIEVAEALKILRNEPLNGPEARFRELCLTMARHTLEAAGLPDASAETLSSGAALAKAEAWFAAQGATTAGPTLEELTSATVAAPSTGTLTRLDAGIVGEAVLHLGGGRREKDDVVDLQVGVRVLRVVGEAVAEGEPLVHVYARTEEAARSAASAIGSGISVEAKPPFSPPLILG